jgi:phospholipid/cholesterol/gamma-HCH transport system substrate-binding protein
VNRVRALAYGAVVVALVAVVIILSSGGSGGYTVTAEFRDVDGLKQGATVKVAGVPAGLVTKLVATKHNTALATLTLDKGATPIGSGASVQVRPTDLLGEHYAQLNVGNLSNPQPSGSFIPTSRTSVPVELDQVLNMLNVDVRTRLRILINEAGLALAGRGADFNTLLANLPPNLSQAQAMLSQVSSENVTLQNLIAEGGRITTSVNGRRDEMGQLIGTAEEALHTVALRQGQLGATLQTAPGALHQLQSTLAQLGSASEAIIPAAQSLQATAAPLTTTLRELPPFARAADGTLVTARQVAPALERLGRGARQPVAALRPTARDVQTLTHSAAPIIGFLDQRAMRDVLWFVENWALAMKGRDNLGHFVGADLEFDPSIITSAVASFTGGGASGAARQRAARHPATRPVAAPVASAPAAPAKPTLGGTVAGLLGGAKGLLGGTTNKLGQTLSAVGGLVGGTLNALGKHKPAGPPAPTGSGSSSGNGSALSGAQQLLNYLLGK